MKKKKVKAKVSVDLLSKYEGYELNQKEVEKEKEELAASSSGRYTIKEGKQTVRLLPPKDRNKKPWVVVRRHYLGKKSILCTEDNSCVGCKLIEYLNTKVDKESKKIQRDLRADMFYCFAMYNRDDKKIYIVQARKTLTARIINPLSHFNPFSPLKGFDFVIEKIVKSNSFPDYSNSYYERDSRPLVGSGIKEGMDAEKVKRLKRRQRKRIINILDRIPDLDNLLVPSDDDVVKAFIDEIKSVIDHGKFKKWMEKNGIEIEMDEAEDAASTIVDLDEEDELEEGKEEEEDEESDELDTDEFDFEDEGEDLE